MASPPPWSDDLLGLLVAVLDAVCSSSWRSVASQPPSSPWSELPDEILNLVMAGLPNLADRARFQLVLTSAAAALDRAARRLLQPRRHLHLHQRVHRTRFATGKQECTPFKRSNINSSFPDSLRCVGSTDGWLALDYADDKNKIHTYFLHNPFSKEVVALPELDAIVGNSSELFQIRKVLIRSTPGDQLVVIMTNNWNYPIILIRPGKGAWLPRPQATPFINIIDIVLLRNRLYGITQAEDLFSLNVSFNADGIPTVTNIKHHIRSGDADSSVESDLDEDQHHYCENEEDRLQGNLYELRTIGDNMINDGILWDEMPYAPNDHLATFWYLLESCGKLIMVKRQLQFPKCCYVKFTRKLEGFEADFSARTWLPVSGGLGGQALFISKRFSKSVSAFGEREEDAIYFIDTGEEPMQHPVVEVTKFIMGRCSFLLQKQSALPAEFIVFLHFLVFDGGGGD
ncbi:hypothetical protein TRIUR3_16607 [Triticum urartu]|uniref:KIB1-4 beta-propeller domain-containing protein n=1 Tax=Triticum urartu TaxID=4572 RepID=M7ZZV5_TRIUA|nr:hypothetical protein TRIUR3_16607 [Triticum urartu]